jgi:hypothetical protein
MKLQLFSDLHTEYIDTSTEWWKMPRFQPHPDAEIVILAGDIGKLHVPKHRQLEKCLRYFSRHWKHVIYVPGNHEFHFKRKRIVDKVCDYERFCQTLPNVHFLYNRAITLPLLVGEVTIYGMVGWTSPRSLPISTRFQITDYQFHSAKELEEESQEGLRSFQQWMESLPVDCNVLVVSHFPPFRSGTSDPRYLQQSNRSLNAYFAWPDENSFLQSILTKPVVRGWFSGHTHWSYEQYREDCKTLFAANQHGYSSEITSFSTSGLITMDWSA